MKKIAALFLLTLLSCSHLFENLILAQNNSLLIYQDASQPIEKRVEDALSRMTLDEKIAILHANGGYASAGVPRLGIPGNFPTDGPSGLRQEMFWSGWQDAGMSTDSCTAFPALVCLAATWNPQLASLFGKAYSEEAIYRNKNIILGPGVNIFRSPMNGRNFEYMGEDPYLTSRMAVEYIKGVQSNNVAACVKHFAVNNQEYNRYSINTLVDERTLHEIYLPAFKAAVTEAKVWAVMGAYNKYDGTHCCHNDYLLNKLLKHDWNFDGVVISDFGGTHNTQEAIFNGLDMEFGTHLGSIDAFENYYLARPYKQLIREGKVGEKELNDKVRRILRMMFRTNLSANRPWGSQASEQHIAASRKIAEEGIVLLKNQRQLLPLNLNNTKKILIVGENAVTPMAGAGGSSEVKAKYEIVPLQGLTNRIGKRVEIKYLQGYSSTADSASCVKMAAEAAEAARNADVVVFIGGLNKQPNNDSEGYDRTSFDLPYHQNELIDALHKANRNLVVVMIAGNAYAIPWEKDVPAIVHAFYGGMEAGNALASVLLGDVNPSGKLPFTFPVSINDNGAHATNSFTGDGNTVEYKEGIFVGYRWHDTKNIKPQFAFGHGLSYTSFRYGKASVSQTSLGDGEELQITVPVTNVGSREGAEVVQMYVHDEKCSLPRPVKELKQFEKIVLKPGETRNVTFTISRDKLSFYDPALHCWVVESGKFKALIGSASNDIRATATFEWHN